MYKPMKKGFTLYELLVCIAIISACTIPFFTLYENVLDKYGETEIDSQAICEDLNISQEQFDRITYNFGLSVDDAIDYRDILAQYGLNVDELTDEQVKQMVEELTENK